MLGRFLEMMEDVAHPNGEEDDDVARVLVSTSSDRGQARRGDGDPARRGRQEEFDDRRMLTPQRRTPESPPSLFRCRVGEENSDRHHDHRKQHDGLQQRRTEAEDDDEEGLHRLVMELERLTTDWINENQNSVADASGPPHKRPRRCVWTSPTPPYQWQGSPRRILGSSQPDLGSDRRFRKLTEDDKDFYERTHRLLDRIEVLMVSSARAKSHRLNDIPSPKSFRRRNSPRLPPTMGSENERPHQLNAGAGAVAAVDAMHPSAGGSDLTCALATCLANLTIHLPVVGACDDSRRRPHVKKPRNEVDAPANALRMSTSLLQRAGNLWMRINLASSERQAIHLTSEQCCLLLERIVEDGSAREFGLPSPSSLSSSSTTRMECLATWLRIVLVSWTDSMVSRVAESCESPNLPSVEWWGRTLTALLGSSTQGANYWTDGLQRLIASSAAASEDGSTRSSAAPPYSQLLSLPLEIASALQTLTVHVLEVLAALINDPSPAVRHRLAAGGESAAASWSRLVETYAEQAVARALRIHDEASTFLHHVEDQHKRRTWEEESRVVTARCCRLVAGMHHQRPDQEGPSNYAHVVALVVDQLDVAYRTNKAAAELDRDHPKNYPLESSMDGTRAMPSQLVREQLFPLWKAVTRLAVSTTMTEKHGRLVTDLAHDALLSLSTAELASSRDAIESVNLTFLRAFKDNPRWLLDSHLLTMSSSHGRDHSIDDNNRYSMGSGETTEYALLALASASLEVRRVLFMAALDVAVERLDLGPPGDAMSRVVQQRLLGLLRRARDCDPDGRADPWTDGFLDEARTRGLL